MSDSQSAVLILMQQFLSIEEEDVRKAQEALP